MAGPTPTQRTTSDLLGLASEELALRMADQAWRLHVAIVEALRANPKLNGDELFRIFRAESFERYERAFSDTSPSSDMPS